MTVVQWRIVAMSASLLLTGCAANHAGNAVDVLFLPEDQSKLLARSEAGTTEWRQLSGLGVMQHADGRTDYIIDRVSMLDGRVRRFLENPMVHRSDIVIRYVPPLRGEYVHLYMQGEVLSDATYFAFAESPTTQLIASMDGGGDPNRPEAVTYLEYGLDAGNCGELRGLVADMIESVRRYLATFGDDTTPPDDGVVTELVLGAVSYNVSARLGGHSGMVEFAVSENSGPIHQPIKIVVDSVRECAVGVPPQRQRFEFKSGGETVIRVRQ